MPQPVQSLPELIAVLKGAIQTDPQGLQFILLDADLFAQAGTLAGFFGPNPLTITQQPNKELLTSDSTSVTLTGTATLFGGVTYDVVMTGTVPATTPLLKMKATPPAGQTWPFATEFPGLPDYTGNDNGSIKTKPSFFNTIVINGAELSVSTDDPNTQLIHLAGNLDATKGDLAPFGTVLSNGASLPVSGTIQVRAGTFALLDFNVAVTDLTIPKLTTVSMVLATSDAVPPDTPAASTIELLGPLTIPSVTQAITIQAPLLQGGSIWAFRVVFGDGGLTLASGLSQLSQFVNGYPLALPTGLDALSWFALQELLIGVVVPDEAGQPPTLQSVGVTVGTTDRWNLPIPGMSIGGLATQWIIISPLSSPVLNGEVRGTIFLGSADDAPRLNVEIDLPAVNTDVAPPVEISADLDTRYPVRLGQVFNTFTGGLIDLDLNVSQLDLLVTPANRNLFVYCVLDGDWPFPIPGIKFTQLNFYIDYSPNSLSGSATASVEIAKVGFAVTAAHPGPNLGWRFSGGLLPGQSIKVVDFFNNLLPSGWPGLPDSLQGLEITKFAFNFDTLSQDFRFETALDWKFELAGKNWEIGADFLFAVTHVGGVAQNSGAVSGLISINDFKVTVAYEFKAQNSSTLTFRIQFKGVSLTCTLSKNDKQESILKANLGGVTFGGIIEYLVNLVDPNLGFSLPAPWDVLNQISFDNLTLTVNLTTKEVGISYKLDKNLGIVDIDTIGLTYVNKAGRKTVDISITGRFFEQKYDDNNPLSWDLLNDPPPTPPGEGPEFLDLRYLGVGQNIGFRDARSFDDVQSVIKALESDFLPADAADQNPLLSPILDKLKFTGHDHWLVGADFTIMGAVSLTVVFNDPVLYGLRIALSGDKVKSFAGLDFQILYKKVTDTIGVYHIVLTLPEAFRQLQFGAVAVTLPIFKLDIYTNGNFRIDMGFPVGLDFSQSFCVQAGPFIGYGGFYFALLDGSTSERVPKVSNGNFSPVIEAGLALSVGLGRTFDKGVISAGVSVTVVAVVEGVFGWFNPNDRSAGSSLFYLIRGTAAIVGKLYGTVNFVVVQAEVNVTAYAQVTLTIEAYQPILIELKVGVEVSVSIKILFFRVHFSFSMTLELSFTIGSGSTPPWIVDTSQPQSPNMLRQQAGAYGRRLLSGARLQRRLLPSLGATGTFDWTPRRVFDGVQTVGLSLVPALTVALPEAVHATHALIANEATGATGPQYQVVMSLFAPNSIPPEARSAKEVRAVVNRPGEVRAVVNLPDADATPFNLLVAGMLEWALSSYTRPPGVTLPPPSEYTLASDLEAISEYLADPDKWQTAFTYDALAAFMELNYVLNVSTPLGPSGLVHPLGAAAQGATGQEVSATIFPMIPELEMGPKGLEPVQFWNYNCITRDYEDALTSYYQQLQVAPGATGATANERVATSFRTEPGPQGCNAGEESLSTFIFRDYFAMASKGAVSGAIDLLKAYPYEPTGSTGLTGGSGPTGPAESLKSIADQFNGIDVQYVTRRGDTLGTIAGRHGISPRKLQVANPHLAAFAHRETLEEGTTVTVNTGVTPEAIVTANPDYPLQFVPFDPVLLTLSGVNHQVKGLAGGGSESLHSVCAQYGLSGPSGPGSLFTFEAQTIPPSNPNVSNTSLLQPGAQLTIPPQTFNVGSPVNASAELVAAFFYVRSLGPAKPNQTPWYDYVQFYEQWMEDNPGASGPAFWDVPLVELGASGNLVVTGTGQYGPTGATGSGLMPDTRELAAGYFAMTQLAPAPFGPTGFNAFLANYVSPTGPAMSYQIADFPYTVQPGDTVGRVAELFGVGVDELADFNAGATGMLQPLAVIALPKLEYPIAEGDTFGSVAANFDLTLDQLADSVENDVGILNPYSPGSPSLTIPDLPGRDADELIDDMANLGRFNDVSGMVTRFLLHGMRAPKPGAESGATFPPDTPLWGLYEMTGQQFPVPQDAMGPSGQFEVRFKKGAATSWVCLDAAATGPTGPTAPSAPVGPTCGDELIVHLDPSFFADTPSPVLDPQILVEPGPLPLYRDTQRQYSITENIHWQAAISPALPGPTGPGPLAGQPSLWNLPQTLLRVAQQGPTGATGAATYELKIANPTDPTGASDLPVSNYSWASAIDVRVQRAPGAGSGQFMPNTYVFLGADQQGRDQLLSAWTFLQNVAPDGQLFILYPPSATSNNSKGLASDSVDPSQTFLLKTNLTTVTRSNQSTALFAESVQTSGDYYARLGATSDFLHLAWEASVTGSGGFYLNYFNTNGGGGLPETLFADGDTATITLLLLTDTQDNPFSPDLGLYPFNNCAVVGDNIDPGSSRLYAAAQAPDPVRVAAVAPGLAGFYLARVNPDPSGATGSMSPDDQTRNLYNLTGYQIAANDYFGESNQGLPAGPSETPAQGVSGPTGPGVWWYQQVLPVYKFGKVNDAPASPALPAPAANPYAGITGASGGPGPLSELDISLAFYDVYGNLTSSTVEPLGVTGPVGYTDELIGVSSWPAAGADFAFVPGPTGGVVLDTLLSLQLDKYSPTPSYTFAQSSGAAAADALRYEQIFYQVQQRDLAFDLQTNLGTTLVNPDDLKAAMSAFVSKAKVFADACASQSQRQYVTKDGDQLGLIAAGYSVTTAMLVAENQNTQVAPLFKNKIVQPVFAVAGPMNTLTLLVENQFSTPYPPACGPGGPPDCTGDTGPRGVFSVVQPGADFNAGAPTATDLQPLTQTELLTQNQNAPLTPGIVLRTESRVDPLPANTPNTLAAAAAALQCVVYATVENPDASPPGTVEIGLYQDNYTATGVVAPNLEITIDGVTVKTGEDPTFEGVEQAFSSLGLDTGDFVVKLENVPGIFAATAKLTHADFIIPQPPPSQTGPSVPVFSIADLPAGCGTLDFLASVNGVVPNFFYSGTALYMSACCYQPQPFDTFASLAEQFNHITLDQLAFYNSTSSLNGGVSLAIPSLTYLEDPADAYAPYSPASADSLDTIARTFGTTAPAIAAINRYLPGIFAAGASIDLGTKYNPGPLDSLQSAAVALGHGEDFGTFVSGIAALTGLYRTNGVVITPLPAVPDAGDGKSPSLAQVAGLFNIQSINSDPVTALLTVNRSLEKFLLEGASLAGPTGPTGPTASTPITVGAHDTVDTILGKFQREQGVEVSVAQLAAANSSTTGLLTTGQQFLLPPNPTEIVSRITPSIPPDGGAGEAAIVFPVGVCVEMTRPPFLVAPDFLGSAPVYQNTSAFSPRGMTPGATSVSLTAFAGDFERAFVDYRLKCAVVQKDAVSDPQQAPQLYAVNFGETGVSRCVVDDAAPQFYALAPLSTELLTDTLPVRQYISGCGLGPAVYKKFDAVDLDSWMGQFLGAVDLFLSAPYAVPAFNLSGDGLAGGFADAVELAPPLTADGPVGLAGRTGFQSFGTPVDFSPSFGLGASGCTGGTGVDGPSNYDDIVAAKYTLAGELKQDVVQILQGVGPTGGYYDGTAQETLYQQMLVRLSDAYTVNAVVQYPVDIQSPCVTPFDQAGATGPIPPRLSGQVVPDLYAAPQTPPDKNGNHPPVTLKDVGTYFGVSLPFFAETIGGMLGLLQTGATAQYDTKTYAIQPSDNFNTVAAGLDVPVDPSWETWAAFVNAVAEQPLFLAGAVFPVVRIARQVYTGDTVETIAEFFGTDAATVREANQSLSGSSEPTVGETLYLTQALPDVTLSTAKVSLGRVGSADGIAPPLSFLFSIKHPRQFRKLFLNLKYVVNEMEFGISNVLDGYQASSWLTFVLPIGSDQGADVGVETTMSQVQIPIPLRSYPVPPTLVAQSGLPTDATAQPATPDEAITQGKLWDYRFDFQSANAAQDSNHVQVSFNLFGGATGQQFSALPASRVDAVFRALAEYIDASQSLAADLARLTKQPDQTAAIAVSVLDTFATNVAAALGFSLFGDFLGERWPTLIYLYKLQNLPANEELGGLVMTLESGPTGPNGVVWPQVFIQSLTAPTAGTGPDAGFLPVTLLGATGMTASYRYPAGFPVNTSITQRFLMQERDVIQNQNASGGVYLTRNDDLISSGPLGTTASLGPTGSPGAVATNEAFLYQTPLVSFIDRLTPFINDPTKIDVSRLSGPSGPAAPPRTLAQHIENMLDAVLELGPLSPVQADSQISILCSYGFPISDAGGPGELVVVTPIRLVPAQMLTPDTKTAFAYQLSESILGWPGWPGPGGPGELIFDFSAYTTAGPVGASGPDSSVKPILEFEYLRVPLSQIVPET